MTELNVFQGFSPEEMAILSAVFERSEASEGMILFEQGETAQYLYLVTQGEVIVRYKPEDGPAMVLSHMDRESVVGWSAVIGKATYSSSAVAGCDSLLLRARGDILRNFCMTNAPLGTRLLERLTKLVAKHGSDPQLQLMSLLQQSLCMAG